LSSAFNGWKCNADAQRHDTLTTSKALGYWRNRLLGGAFAGWRNQSGGVLETKTGMHRHGGAALAESLRGGGFLRVGGCRRSEEEKSRDR
jgi:hypothetical protein